jgi:hypothetical protein
MEQIDGKPAQRIELTGKDGEPVRVVAGFNFIKNGGADTDNTANA